MLAKGKAKKLSVYLSETDTRHGRPLYEALVTLAHKHGIAGATVSRGVMGFGAGGRVHTAGLVEAGGHLPLKVEIVDAAEAVDHLLPEVYEMVEEGLVELSDVEIVRVKPRPPPRSPQKPEGPHRKLRGKARMLRIHVGANDQWEGEPLHEALLKRFHLMDLAGVTAYRGLMGYGASGRIHRRKAWRSADEPITLVVVDTADKIETAMPVVDEMVEHGMAVLSEVEVVFYRGRETAEEPASSSTPGPARPIT